MGGDGEKERMAAAAGGGGGGGRWVRVEEHLLNSFLSGEQSVCEVWARRGVKEKRILANQLKCVFQRTQRKSKSRLYFFFLFVLIIIIRDFDTAQKTHSHDKS